MKKIQDLTIQDGYIFKLRNNSFRVVFDETLHDGGVISLNGLRVKVEYNKWDIGIYEYSNDGNHESDLSLDIVAIYNEDMLLLWEKCDLKEGDLVLCKNKPNETFEEIGCFINFDVVNGERQYKISRQINNVGFPIHSTSENFKICRKVVS